MRLLKKDFKIGVKFLALYRDGTYEYIEMPKVNDLISTRPLNLIRIVALTKEAQIYPLQITESQSYTIKKITIRHIRK